MKTLYFILLLLPASWLYGQFPLPRQNRHTALTNFEHAAKSRTPSSNILTALDSIDIYYNNNPEIKRIYRYDDAGHTTEEIVLVLTPGSMENSFRITSDYENDLLRLRMYWNLDTDADRWNPLEKMEYYYNDRNLNDSVYFARHENNGWVPDRYQLYEYNDAGLKTQSVNYAFLDNNWVPSDKILYHYDNQYRLSEFIWQLYQNGAWQNFYKDIHLYNSQGLFYDYQSYYWTGNDWEEDYRELAHYTPEAIVDTILYFYSYTNGHWVPASRDVFGVDDYGNWTDLNMEDYDGNRWELEFRVTFSYDNSLEYNQLLTPEILGNEYFINDRQFFRHKLDSLEQFDYESGTITDYSCLVFHYSPHQIAVEEAREESLEIFPNPASDFVYIKETAGEPVIRVSIFDLNGQEIKKWAGNKTFYSLKELAKGTYILRIRTPNTVRSFKLIKR